MQEHKIHVLVIPDLFPKFRGDIQGVFILDYLESAESFCDQNVLSVKLQGEKKGMFTDKIGNVIISRYFISEKKVNGLLKAFYYLKWFHKGFTVGKAFHNTNIIHCHGSILSGTLGYLLSRKLKVPFIITEHQGPFSMTSESFWKRNWTRFIMQKANEVLCVSDHLKKEILNTGIRPLKITVSNNPVDTEIFCLKNTAKTRNILFAGRLDNFKGALRTLKAFHNISSEYPDWIFTIVGDGEDSKAISEYIKVNKELANRVKIRGQLSKKELAVQMHQSDFLVFPSRHESFGLVIAEAMSCGLPVVTTNRTAPPEFVKENSGLLVDPDNIDKIADAMELMINDLSSYDPTIIRQEIVSNFSFENFGKKLAVIYKSHLNKT